MMRLFHPLSYLGLLDEKGGRLVLQDAVAVVLLAAVLTIPFVLFDANYFGVGGFLERFGTFSSVLTGFYIAALVAVATFASTLGDLDQPIKIGAVFTREQFDEVDPDGDRFGLSRREYVCAMFGYLAFVSLVLSVGAIAAVILAAPVRGLAMSLTGAWRSILGFWLPGVVIALTGVVIAHLVVTTCYGLYYLVDRLYAKAPTISPIVPNPAETPSDHVDEVCSESDLASPASSTPQ